MIVCGTIDHSITYSPYGGKLTSRYNYEFKWDRRNLFGFALGKGGGGVKFIMFMPGNKKSDKNTSNREILIINGVYY